MSFSSVISFLKSYPLMICVIVSSIILAIVFAVQKNDADTGTIENSPASATIPLQEPPTFATDANGVKIEEATTVTSEPVSMENISGETTAMTTEPPVQQYYPVENVEDVYFYDKVEDEYFHDALFIGNSRTVGLSMFGSMPEETTFYATVGMNIYDLMDSSAQIPPEEGPEQSFQSLLAEKQFGKIYIMLGINDLGTGTSESFAEYYKGIVDQIHQMQPGAIIYIQSIINISSSRDAQGDAVNNANINEKNALLKRLANDEYIFYLDVNEVLIDENGCLNSDYTSDGIHLGGSSLPIWEDYLYTHAIVR